VDRTSQVHLRRFRALTSKADQPRFRARTFQVNRPRSPALICRRRLAFSPHQGLDHTACPACRHRAMHLSLAFRQVLVHHRSPARHQVHTVRCLALVLPRSRDLHQVRTVRSRVQGHRNRPRDIRRRIQHRTRHQARDRRVILL
jgi:hypothetical protein